MKAPERTIDRAQDPVIANNTVITVVACIFIALCEGFDLQAPGVAAAGLNAELAPTPDQLGTFFSAGTLGLMIGAPISGRLSDSFGRVRLLLVSVILFGAFTSLTAFMHTMETLSWTRLLTGIGLGGALPNLVALVNESSAEHRRRANVALAYCGMPLGGAIASVISMFNAPAHWRWIFAFGGLVPLLVIPVLLRVRIVTRDINTRPHVHSTSSNFRNIFSGGRAASTAMLWVSSCLQLLTLYLLLSWLPTLLIGLGFGRVQASGMQGLFNLGGAIAALMLGQLLEGKAGMPSLIVLLLGAPICVALLSRAPAEFPEVALIVFVLGASVVSAQGFLYATAPRVYPAIIRGMALGVAVAVGRLGSIAGPKLGGALKAAGHTPAQLLIDVLPLVVLGSVSALIFARLVARSNED